MLALKVPDTLSLNQLIDFIRSRGWTSKSSSENEALIYSPDDKNSNKIKFYIGSYDREEFKILTGRLLSLIAEVENCTVSDIFNSLNHFYEGKSGVYQCGIKLKFGEDNLNSIRISEVEAATFHIRMALAYSIQVETTAQAEPYLDQINPLAAIKSKGFNFEHTQQGSFIIVVRAPSILQQMSLIDPTEFVASIENRSIARLAKGFDTVFSNKFNLKSYEDIRLAVSNGINYNVANHMLNLFKDVSYPSSSIVFNVRDELRRKYKIDRLTFNVGNNELQILEDFKDLILEPQIITDEFKVKVVSMKSYDPMDESYKHIVKLKIVGQPYLKLGTIAVNLDPDSYSLAVTKHLSNETLSLAAKISVSPEKIEVLKIISLV